MKKGRSRRKEAQSSECAWFSIESLVTSAPTKTDSIQLRRTRRKKFESQTVGGGAAGIHGEIKVFGDFVVFRQKREIQPVDGNLSQQLQKGDRLRRNVVSGLFFKLVKNARMSSRWF